MKIFNCSIYSLHYHYKKFLCTKNVFLLFSTQAVYIFFFPETYFCTRIFRDSWIEWHTWNAVNYRRPEAARTTGKR